MLQRNTFSQPEVQAAFKEALIDYEATFGSFKHAKMNPYKRSSVPAKHQPKKKKLTFTMYNPKDQQKSKVQSTSTAPTTTNYAPILKPPMFAPMSYPVNYPNVIPSVYNPFQHPLLQQQLPMRYPLIAPRKPFVLEKKSPKAVVEPKPKTPPEVVMPEAKELTVPPDSVTVVEVVDDEE